MSKISIIIPVYNVSKYLRKCLESVINQTYQNLEIIVINDGSTDGCDKICDEYAKKDNRIRVIHQSNKGLSEARNSGLKVMTGEFVGFVDPDDWIEPNFYELLEKRMREKNADIVMMGYYFVYKNKIKKCRLFPENFPCDSMTGLKALSENKISHVVWNKLYRKKLFNNLYFCKGRLHEDVLITYQLILGASKIECLNVYGYYQMMRASSICHSKGDIVMGFLAHYDLWQDMMKYKEEITFDIIHNFYIQTVYFAYRTLFQDFIACEERYPSAFFQAKQFWKSNRKEIASINWKYWFVVHFSFLFRFKNWIREKMLVIWKILRKLYKFHKEDRVGNLFE